MQNFFFKALIPPILKTTSCHMAIYHNCFDIVQTLARNLMCLIYINSQFFVEWDGSKFGGLDGEVMPDIW